MANDGNMDEEVFVHGNRLTAMRQNNNSGIYKSRSILGISSVRDVDSIIDNYNVI